MRILPFSVVFFGIAIIFSNVMASFDPEPIGALVGLLLVSFIAAICASIGFKLHLDRCGLQLGLIKKAIFGIASVFVSFTPLIFVHFGLKSSICFGISLVLSFFSSYFIPLLYQKYFLQK